MSSESYNYTDTPNVNLVCCICRSPFIEPCTTRTCCHTFCYDCVAQAIAVNHQCPIDRTLLSLHDLIPADPVIRNLVDELSVRCPQEHLGCTYTCQRLLLPIHISDSCQYVEVPCPDAGCTERVLRKDAKHHKCADESSESQPKSVPDEMQQKESDTTGSSTGPTAFSGLPGDLAAENAMLRLRLSALESVVHTLRSEMFAVKHALGPWYQPDVQSHIREGTSENLEDSSEAFERQLAEELAAQPPAPALAPPPAVTGGLETPAGADIASYFPPAEEVAPQMASRPSRHRSIPHIYPAQATGQPGFPNSPPYAATLQAPSGQTPSGMSYTQGASFPISSPAAISIPPLDPTTPLPDTLASLHSTLVTLAGALGALAATRGAESLRTTEELRGLRGAMHGLRMQVHDILTSRTHLAGASGSPGASTHGDTADGAAPYNATVPGWFGYGPRAYGIGPLHHPPPFGVPPVPPPTNITKL